MGLRVYNTLTRTKEDFQTVEPGKVGMYLCGPTVYKPAHIGHMVGPVIFDTVKRYLSYSGYDVTFVINITDIDDKLISKAAEENTTVELLAEQMTIDYFENLTSMGVDSIDHFPKATDHIQEMLGIIQNLVETDYAYPLEGDVYFRVEKDDDYGKLSGRKIDDMLAGTRVEANDRKQNPADFALWKRSKEGEPAWDSPWGPGRPGWHIECSAMSLKLLGQSFDIHGGGLDLLFPHHENELAQSESRTGQTFAKYWMHNGLMQSGTGPKVGGQHDRHGDVGDNDIIEGDAQANKEAQEANKLAGSKGAESIKTAVFAHHPPETVRFFLLSTHYRSPIDFSLENIAKTGKSIEGFYRLFETFERITGNDFYALEVATTREQSASLDDRDPLLAELKTLRERYLEVMDDDFNTGGAIGVLFEMRRAINGFVLDNKLDASGDVTDEQKTTLTSAMTQLKELAQILGVFRKPVEKVVSARDDEFARSLLELIIDIRKMARETKSWDIADKIRDSLTELKVTLEDRPDGTIWRRD